MWSGFDRGNRVPENSHAWLKLLWGGISSALPVILLAAWVSFALAQPFPARSVRIVIAFPPGGSIDTLGRLLGQKLSEKWGQSVVIENRPGAGGNLGAAAAAQAAPDGYTLHLGAQSLAVNVSIAPLAGFDPVRDFVPIILVGTVQDVLMTPPEAPYRTVSELVEYAKARSGELTYASLGQGSSGHLATALFAQMTGLKLQHVPYSTGFSPAMTDLMTGRLSMWLATLGGALPHIESGKVRALAVSGHSRAEALPHVPTFKETGVDMEEESTWFGFFAPRGAAAEIISKVNGDVGTVLNMPEVKERARPLGYRFVGGTPEKLARFLDSEIAKWAKVAASAELKSR
jgi:tripartite-type tricarboxylate transporter receptor subunit TctC